MKPTLKTNKRRGFSTNILDSRIKEQSRVREQRRKDFIKKVFSALDEFACLARFDRVFIFGSVTKRGQFGKNSDVDIGFFGLEDNDMLKATAYLSKKLGIDVDVVQLEGHKFANSIKRGVEWKKGK